MSYDGFGARGLGAMLLSGWGTHPDQDITIALPYILDLTRSGQSAEYVWENLPAPAIQTHVGEGGWWYDDATGTRLSVADADRRKNLVVAGAINAHIGAEGYWYDNPSGQRLTDAQAFGKLVALEQLLQNVDVPDIPPPAPPAAVPPPSYRPPSAPPALTPPLTPPATPPAMTTPTYRPPTAPPATVTTPTTPATVGGVRLTPTVIGVGAAVLVAGFLFLRRRH